MVGFGGYAFTKPLSLPITMLLITTPATESANCEQGTLDIFFHDNGLEFCKPL